MATCQFKDKNNLTRTFIHIPKTAGQSLTLWFNHFDKNLIKYGGHTKPQDLENSGVSLRNTFTFVRNPYSRAVSAYLYYQENALKQVEQVKEEAITPEQIKKWKERYKGALRYQKYFTQKTFDEWIHECRYNPKLFALIVDPQINYLYKVEQIYKIEELDKHLPTMKQWFFGNRDFPKINVSNTNGYDYRDFYKRKSTRKIVYKYFKEDFNLLGYKF
jgi:hypothetical protein